MPRLFYFIRAIKLNRSYTLLYFLLGLVFLIAPFISAPNIGGTGLRLPFNTSIWVTFPWLIYLGLFTVLNKKEIVLPKGGLFFVPFLIAIIVVGYSNNSEPVAWLFRQATIFAGFAFFFILFQFQLKTRQIELILYGLVISTGLHAIVTIVQVHFPAILPPWLPPSFNNKPTGLFQQVNIQASYMATGIVTMAYLLSRPYFRNQGLLNKVFISFLVSANSYVLFLTGSRIGLLTLVLGLFLVGCARYRFLEPKKIFIALLISLISMSAFIAKEEISQSVEKTKLLSKGEYKAARLSMYKIGFDLVLAKPLTGHGIGSFKKVWSQQAGKFIKEFPNAALPTIIYTSHPHNELLYWLIEAGIVVVAGILLLVFGIGLALYKCGFSRGLAYTAILTPITLHTQVELPFYGSSLHWLTWIFLLFLPMQHLATTFNVSLSNSAKNLIYLSGAGASVLCSVFMLHTYKAQTDIFNFLMTDSKPPYLQTAMSNIYFKSFAVELAMRAKLYNGLESGNHGYVDEFTNWAIQRGNGNSLQNYEDLLKAYAYYNYKKMDCAVIIEAHKIYPSHEQLASTFLKCN
jgi:O-antigen polymerase